MLRSRFYPCFKAHFWQFKGSNQSGHKDYDYTLYSSEMAPFFWRNFAFFLPFSCRFWRIDPSMNPILALFSHVLTLFLPFWRDELIFPTKSRPFLAIFGPFWSHFWHWFAHIFRSNIAPLWSGIFGSNFVPSFFFLEGQFFKSWKKLDVCTSMSNGCPSWSKI